MHQVKVFVASFVALLFGTFICGFPVGILWSARTRAH